MRFLAFLIVLSLSWPAQPAARTAASKIYVFAAVSTAFALREIEREFAKADGGKVTTVFAPSGSLAQQIAYGAPADIFLSADKLWMDWLLKRNLIDRETAVDLLGNCLVLVQPVEDKPRLTLDRTLARQIGDRRLAVADPVIAPLGAYTREALQSLGLWKELERKLVMRNGATATLAIVERGEVAGAIVYRSGALSRRRVRIVAPVPPPHHPRIVYRLGLVTGRGAEKRSEAGRYIAFLKSETAMRIFRQYGFVTGDRTCPS
jgi:molybdate transport system substrate-binding protein